MLRGEQHTRTHLRLGHTGHHPHEVQHEFGIAMGDDRQVAIDAISDLLADLDVQLVRAGLVLFVCHGFLLLVRCPPCSERQVDHLPLVC